MDTGINIKPIGVIHVDLSDEEVRARWPDGVEGTIEVYEEYAAGLDGIDGFSHIIVVAYMHKVPEEGRRVLKVRPKRLRLLGLDADKFPEVGVFCTDSPHRPNPIAISIVELISRSGRFLKVRNLDLFDGTPVLDIKPYTPSRRVEEIRLPEWYHRILDEVRARYPNLRDF